MELIADRFAVDEDRAIDLSNFSVVSLAVRDAGPLAEQAQWTARCDRLFRLRHRLIAPLVDYGLLGRSERFEAWQTGVRWRGSTREAERVVKRVEAFLEAVGWTGLTCDGHGVRNLNGRAVIVPDQLCGFEREECSRAGNELPLDAYGLAVVGRPELGEISEMFEPLSLRVPAAVGLYGVEGVGMGPAIGELARAARLAGLIPVGRSLARSEDNRVRELLRGRSLLVIGRDGDWWRWPLEWSIRSPRPHVFLFAGRNELSGVPGIVLKRLPIEALIQAVRPEPAGAMARRADSAARRSAGIPGRFVELLFGSVGGTRVLPYRYQGTKSRAAEQAPTYGDDLLAHRMDAAIQRLGKGHCAAGDRLLRQAVGGYSRRHDWERAARGQLILARSLLRRGHAQDAHRVLAEARDYATRGARGEAEPALLDVAVLSGVAWTDLARLEQAEAVLQTAVQAAAGGEPSAQAWSRLALARCLFWRGRFCDAAQALDAIDPQPLSEAMRVALEIAGSRVAIGRRALGVGMAAAAAALERARKGNDPSLVAEASCATAFAHLSIGDGAGLNEDLKTCIRAARMAHDPLRALRARLMGAEGARRSGRQAPASALLGRLSKLRGSRLPATVAARCALLKDLLSPTSSSPSDIVHRHVASTGLHALALFAPMNDTEGAGGVRGAMDAAEAVSVLRCCQTAEDEETTLREVCGRLRTLLRAAVVAFVAPDRGSAPVASDGGRLEIGIAERVLAAREFVRPDLLNGRVEGGVPVLYCGTTVGALVARWPLAVAPDPPRTSALLALASAAAGPAFAAVVARQARQAPADDLVGVGASLVEVRRAVERAASSPFAVLVCGESGSGKELVARALHQRSARRARPFCTLNCAALPDDLVEAELFGHSRGAFTGAVAERPGVFEEAHLGTLFLDEIGELSPRAQAKLLRVIQDGELRRVGENIARRIDVRIISATNRDLKDEVAAGRFRLDLLYRLDVIRIAVPPLRDRRQDVAALAEQLWREATARIGSRAALSSAAIAALARYDWPGNVRELQNVLAALAVRSPKRGVVPPTALPPAFHAGEPPRSLRLDHAKRGFEEQFVRAALVRSGGTRSQAAVELGLSRQGLIKLMKRLGISEE